jgi:hypothetical protein
MKIESKSLSHFNLAWLGYLGFVGLLGFVWEPLRALRTVALFCLFFLYPYRKNFRFFFQVVLYAFGQIAAVCRVWGRLPRPGRWSQKAHFSLPFEGFWTVAAGGVDKENSHSWNVFNQRYAYDFFIEDQDGKTFRHNGKTLKDYYSFGKTILAPADGLVVKVKDNVRDNPELRSVDIRVRIFQGNFVVIKHGEGEYGHLAHLKKGSIAVKEGEKVRRGQTIGLCGNSGHSLEPHLHFHLQDRASFYFSIGLPVEFSDFIVRRQGQIQNVSRGYLSKGHVVMNGK